MAINTDEAYVSSLNVSSLSGSGARFKRKTLKACDPCRRRKGEPITLRINLVLNFGSAVRCEQQLTEHS